MTTIRDTLRQARSRFAPVSDSAVLDAHVLLCAVLGVERSYLLAHPEAELTSEQQARFERMVERHAAGEPVAYILGRRAFYDRDFAVTPDVLIPRPETELLLERALAFAREHPVRAAVDVGTGSGALAVTFAAHVPDAQVYAIDVSAAALAVAKRNADEYSVTDQITFMQGDLVSPLIEQGIRVDLVMANLPYIATEELPGLAVSRYEPLLALDGGPDGLNLVRRLVAQLPRVCRPGALALLEIGADQGSAVLNLVGESGVLHKDYAGLDRFVEYVPV